MVFRKLSLLIFTALLYACASIQAPQGGPKDNEPPVLLSTNPKQMQVNFRENQILLEFSENVLENEPRQPFLSPITQVTVKALGKKMKIEADSGWQSDQTYELRLSKKIKDEREGNLARDSSILFSTGNEPDRIELIVKTENLSGNPQRNRSLLLLESGKNRKYHGTGEGSIRIRGLKEGKYHILVFNDKNDNMKYEEEDGMLFIDSLQLDSSIGKQCRPLPQTGKKLRFFHLRKGDTLQIEGSKSFKPDSTLLTKLIAKNQDGSLYHFFPLPQNQILFQQDSLGSVYPDTLLIQKVDSNRSINRPELKKKIHVDKAQNQIQIDQIWNWKVKKHPGKIEICRDSVWEPASWEKLDFGYRIRTTQSKPGKIQIRMDSIEFFNRFRMKKDSILIQASDLEEKGNLSGEIFSTADDLMAELINQEKEVIVRSGKGKFNWKVKPGRYRLQVFIDTNRDGQYTGGNRNRNQKAEPLYVFPDPIELKPGWDLENIKVTPVF
jgi:uncharacterized protein (DUF2141 family)